MPPHQPKVSPPRPSKRTLSNSLLILVHRKYQCTVCAYTGINDAKMVSHFAKCHPTAMVLYTPVGAIQLDHQQQPSSFSMPFSFTLGDVQPQFVVSVSPFNCSNSTFSAIGTPVTVPNSPEVPQLES